MADIKKKYWNLAPTDVFVQLETTDKGLTQSEAAKRLDTYGVNSLQAKKTHSGFILLLSQFKSPIIWLLLVAVGISIAVKDAPDALIILAIVLVSGLLSFFQEYGANNAVKDLLAMVQVQATVLRDGAPVKTSIEKLVPGDVVLLDAGDVIAGDCLILESNSLFVDEATLTGETYPMEKQAGVMPQDTALADRKNCLWMGTHVISGTATALIVKTGLATEFGAISQRLKLRPQETEFERGVRRFGFLLMEITLVLTIIIFALNVFLHKPILDSFLFSLALAVGLTPQLLPAIISINLAHGARMMAKAKVIVKRLASIENFGSMDVLCSDKTGTLTDGVVQVQSVTDVDGNPSDKILKYAYLNSSFESGFVNPIDEAIRNYTKIDLSAYSKIGEEPYDFIRKRLSIFLSKTNEDLSDPDAGHQFVVTKGALKNVLEVCTKVELSDGTIVDVATVHDKIQKQYETFSNLGYRTMGISYKNGIESHYEKEHESDMIFLGFITLFDPLKPDIVGTINELKSLGVHLKIITGDNRLIAANVVSQLGIPNGQVLTGTDLQQMSNDALLQKAKEISIFAEVEPNQKERIINALKKAGFVVGYMGDGINDASALHAADVSISVESAADVAKEAADIVLLEKDLRVLISGVKAGRITFANTLKYVFMATSANFGNMFSMAGASLFLPFLPLLPKQVLLTNLLTDFPEMTIASDTVDIEQTIAPRRWNIRSIQKFMLTFGLVSSIFDYLTFAMLIFLVHATDVQFRTGWFLESVISASMIVLVIRTKKPFYKSPPGKYLLIATLTILVVTLSLPYTPLAPILGFIPLPWWVLAMIGGIVVLYIITAEIAKKIFYKRVKM